MIYFRRNNGELGAITYGAKQFDLEMIKTENKPELFEEIAKSIKISKKESIFDRLPVDKSALLVLVK